eukprot:6492596-Amphidinium_carterae.1
MCLPCEDEVDRLLESKKRVVGKTSLGMIGKTIAMNGWWMEQLQQHVAEIPGLAQWSERLKGIKVELAAIGDVSLPSLQQLTAITKDMGQMQVALRASRVEEAKQALFSLVAKLKTSIDQAMDTQGCFNADLLQKFQILLHDMTTVFPEHALLYDMLDAVGLHMQSSTKHTV